MKRVFLDANVVFSAAYREQSGLSRLWELKGIKLITSTYAAQEADRNLESSKQVARLQKLLESVEVVKAGYSEAFKPRDIKLPDKDLPIMQAAVESNASYLLTGDITHFGAYLGKTVHGVTISTPAEFNKKYK
jgi:uncharacterized protein